MKFKKMLSYLAATAIAASSFAAMAVTANAADSVTYTWDFTDSTWFTATYNAGSSIKSQEGTESSTILSNPGAKFSLNTSSVSGYQVVKTEAAVTNAMQIVVPAGGSASLSIQLTTGSSGKALYIRDAQSTAVLTANDYTKNVLSTYTASLTPGATYTLDTTSYKAYIGKVALTVTASDGGDPVVDTKYAITVAEGIENGSVSINGGLTEAAAGATVNVTATPAEGYILDSITVNGTAITGTSFTMPSEAAVVSATFKEHVVAVQQKMTLGTVIDTADLDNVSIADTGLIGDYISATGGGTSKEVKVENNLLKLGGKGTATSGRRISVIPAAAGTLIIDFVHPSSSGKRTLEAFQNEAALGSAIVDNDSDPKISANTLSVNVTADAPVYIYGVDSALSIKKISLVEASPEPQQQFYNKGYTFTTSADDVANKYTKLTIRVIDTANENKPGYAEVDLIDKLPSVSGTGEFTLFIKNIKAEYTVTSVELD